MISLEPRELSKGTRPRVGAGIVLVLGIGIGLSVSGCRRPGEDQPTESVTREDIKKERAERSPAFIAQLDSGNAAFKAKDYERALRHYQNATKIEDDEPAGWFGIYMTELARGNAAAADVALKRAQQHAPGATLIHP
jgi:hypothetical protein